MKINKAIYAVFSRQGSVYQKMEVKLSASDSDVNKLIKHPSGEAQSFFCRRQNFMFNLIASKAYQSPRKGEDVDWLCLRDASVAVRRDVLPTPCLNNRSPKVFDGHLF